MPLTTLIETPALARQLIDQGLAIIDCRYDLRDEAWGRRQYAEGHIPGAEYASLDADLSGEKNGRTAGTTAGSRDPGSHVWPARH